MSGRLNTYPAGTHKRLDFLGKSMAIRSINTCWCRSTARLATFAGASAGTGRAAACAGGQVGQGLALLQYSF